MGTSTSYVCSCCFACQCCCPPRIVTGFIDGSSAGVSLTETYLPQNISGPVQPNEIYVYA